MSFQTAIITPARNVLASQSLKRIDYELDRVCQEIDSSLSPDALFFCHTHGAAKPAGSLPMRNEFDISSWKP